MESQRKGIKLFVKLSASDVEVPPKPYRDVTSVGHYGTGDSEFTIATDAEFEQAKPFINKLGVNIA